MNHMDFQSAYDQCIWIVWGKEFHGSRLSHFNI